jgi:hypothetical protein
LDEPPTMGGDQSHSDSFEIRRDEVEALRAIYFVIKILIFKGNELNIISEVTE